MAQAIPRSGLPRTIAEFDDWNREQPERWEFIAGVPVMMSPAANNHTLIKGNVFAALHRDLRGRTCRPMVDGAEIRTANLSAIPDVIVTCSAIDGRSGQVDGPVVLVEVLSPSSERDDTGRKWQEYCLIESLQHYIVIAQDRRFVTLHTRKAPFVFEERVLIEGELPLDAIGVTLSLDEIYDGIAFAADSAEAL